MEVLRYYIHYKDYKNAILVSKNWRDYLIDCKGAMMFARIMSKHGYIMCYKKDIDILKELKGLEMLKCIIESLEYTRKRDFDLFLKKYTYPVTYFMSFKLKNRPNLRHIDLMGY